MEKKNLSQPLIVFFGREIQEMTISFSGNVLRIDDKTPALGNLFRTIMQNEIVVLASHFFIISRNTSIITNSELCSRIGLIPLCSSQLLFLGLKNYYQCECKNGCLNCCVSYTLRVKNETTGGSVTDGFSLKVLSQMIQQESHCEFNFLPATGKVEIVPLGAGQEIDLRFLATPGIGKIHSKYNAAHVSYRILHEPVVEQGVRLTESDGLKIVRLCPMNIFSFDQREGILSTIKERLQLCSACQACTDSQSTDDIEDLRKVVNVVKKTDPKTGTITVLMEVESFGFLTPDEIFNQASQILLAKLLLLYRELQKKSFLFLQKDVKQKL